MSSLDQYLSLRQKQELALKPKMLQSLKMLSLPILELEAYIKQELINNPLLEQRDEKDEDDIEDHNFEPEAPESPTSIEESEAPEQSNTDISEAKELTEILDQWNDFHLGHDSYRGESETEHTEAIIRFEEDGKDIFLEQLYPYKLSEVEFEFCVDLVDNCDAYGFLPRGFDLVDFARMYQIKALRVKELHEIIMSLSPKGITARDISECLYAQLTEEQKENKLLVGIINEQFENLIHRRYQRITSYFGVSEESVLNARDLISRLDPKPGLRILNPSPNYVFPDVTVKMIEGEFVVVINDQITPNIIISPRYRRMITRGDFNKETMQFVRDKINSAKFLIKSIYMRMRTLERVMLSIIKYQPEFFYDGSGVMLPLTYSVIAQDLGVSESTISRVVKYKFAETPYGIYALKDFFSSTAGRDDNYESVSRQKVKSHIARFIEQEDDHSPLSDQDLVQRLAAEGLYISRRIIAKYRDELGILNSRLRKNKR
ncbi:MAG: RNA polymerase factor sigma-54 [Candidatus Cloacimonetes bacterium]|nr:RNA polymerase factor sigma-54 [Candidatus Cloacimonadota bacterium]